MGKNGNGRISALSMSYTDTYVFLSEVGTEGHWTKLTVRLISKAKPEELVESRIYYIASFENRPAISDVFIYQGGYWVESHGGIYCRTYTALEDKSLHIYDFKVKLLGDFPEDQTMEVQHFFSFDPVPKRITDIYQDSVHTLLVDVHGVTYTTNGLKYLNYGDDHQRTLNKLRCHMCQLTSIQILYLETKLKYFTGFGDQTEKPLDDEVVVVVVGDKDGIITLMSMDRPDRILSVCTGNTAEITSMACRKQKNKDGKDELIIYATDTEKKLTIQCGFTGKIQHCIDLSSTYPDMSEFYMFNLLRVPLPERIEESYMLGFSTEGACLYEINIETGSLVPVSSISITNRSELTALANNVTVHFAHGEYPLFCGKRGDENFILSIDKEGEDGEVKRVFLSMREFQDAPVQDLQSSA